jgi:arginine decarboxylase
MSRSRANRLSPDASGPSTGVHYNMSRLRMDAWHRLRDHARRLAKAGNGSDAEEAGDDPDRWREEVAAGLAFLKPYEAYWAFPGTRVLERLNAFFQAGAYEALAAQSGRVVRLLANDSYRRMNLASTRLSEYADLVNVSRVVDSLHETPADQSRPYFEVLIVDDLTREQETELRLKLRELRSDEDDFIYEIVVAPTYEDALAATVLNSDIQTCVVRYIFPFRSRTGALSLIPETPALSSEVLSATAKLLGSERSRHLGRVLKGLRPELDLFLVTDSPLEQVAGHETEAFDRLFHRQDYYGELHLSILKCVASRAETPFLTALRRYSRNPTGVFHALPIGRGKSILKSRWIRDTATFFGPSGFTGETSATTGGLDSLLQPHGPLKRAQELAARAFGARKTWFVTNGTSTANKIVMQGLVRPGDIVLLAHDCHKSHPYAVIMSGAHPVYLDAYPLSEYSMYGGVPLSEIKRELLALRRAGKLDRVKMLLLTNITFDGITYDPARVMEEVLAIKPDMVFVWDEAWFAYGRFHPTLRRRTAMDAAARLEERLKTPEYRARYEAWSSEFAGGSEAGQADTADDRWIESRLLPDPDRATVRVYATQSTHKTLTSLRQGSMIHVRDQEFDQKVSEAFEEAYMTHTSTSPNYPILASLDMGRRQVELEGYRLVQESVEIAMTLRERIHSDPLLQRYFRVLGPRDMVEEAYRPSGLEFYFDPDKGWSELSGAWDEDEFTLDPTRITLHVGRTGLDGNTFKRMLMDRFSIQVNKTSRNTVLFLIHIGTTPATIAHLVKVLTTVARELDEQLAHQSEAAARLHRERVSSLTEDLPPLPNFSRFHPAFLSEPDSETPEGDMRGAFFLAYDAELCDHLKLGPELVRQVADGKELVSASFVTPYPPGFPVLVPGQVISREILSYLLALDVKEIHGYRPEYGLRIFRESVVEARALEHRRMADEARLIAGNRGRAGEAAPRAPGAATSRSPGDATPRSPGAERAGEGAPRARRGDRRPGARGVDHGVSPNAGSGTAPHDAGTNAGDELTQSQGS